MTGERRDDLPERAREVIEAWVARSGAEGPAAERIRDDFREHFLDGLARGRTLDEVIAAFGDPEETAALLDEVPAAPSPARPDGWSLRAWLDGLSMDGRLALRTLRRAPVFALTITGVLAAGIGANAVTFSVLDELLLEPLPVHDPSTLVHVLPDVPGGNSFSGFSIGDFRDLQEQNQGLLELAAMSAARVPLGDLPTLERVVVSTVSSNYFGALGVGAHLGTVRLPDFTGWGANPVAVVSHAFWEGRLGAAPDVVGSTLRVNGTPLTVIGVAEPPFQGTFIGFPTEIWTPLSEIGTYRSGFDPEDRGEKFLELFGRRRATTGNADVEAELDAIAARIEAAWPELNRGHRVRVVSMTGIDESLRVGVFAFTAVLTVVAALVLLVACLNVGSILLVRTMAREREIAIRLAVGAGTRRLLGQTMVETLILVAAATAVGWMLAARATAVLRDFVVGASGGVRLELALSGRVLALTIGVAVLAACVASLAPGLHLARREPAGVLRERGGAGGGTHRLRTALVVGQVALSVLLATSSGLFVRALSVGLTIDPGFDADRVASIPIAFDADRYGSARATAVQRDLVREVAAVPGVEAVAWSGATPIGVGRSPRRVNVAGVEPPPGEDGFPVDVRLVGGGYFEAVGIVLAEGGPIVDVHDTSPDRVAVVSRAFVDRFFAGASPLGRTLEVDGTTARVVGVAPDARYVLQDDTPDPLVYLSFAGEPRTRAHLVFRTRADPTALARPVEAILDRVAPEARQAEVRAVRQTLSDGLFPQRVGAAVVGVMGLLALVLAAVGLYGLVQFTVSRDLRSLGIRLALGGGRGDIVRAVLKRGLLLTMTGLGIGVGVAVLVTPGLRPFLVGVRSWDPTTYLTVVLTFVLVSLAASLGPALRASRVDPVVSLRAD